MTDLGRRLHVVLVRGSHPAESTVRTHRQHICLKLQVPNIAAAVAVALREGKI